jgi:hypothetical protein
MFFDVFPLPERFKHFTPEAFYFNKFHFPVICSLRDAILRGSISPTHSKI